MKNFLMLVAEYMAEGLDEVEIANKLDLPVDMIEDVVKMIEKEEMEENSGSNYLN
jgi:hypothetical protein